MNASRKPRENVKHADRRSNIWARGLKRPEIWGVFVATFALLLSQLPPVLSIAKGKSIRISSTNIASLATEYMGFPVLLVHVGVENVGGQPVTIQRFICDLTHTDSGQESEMPVYVSMLPGENPSSQMKVSPLGWISLNVGEVWSGLIRCASSLTEEQLRINFEIQDEFMQSVEERRARQIFGRNQPVQVPEHLYAKAKELFDKRFRFTEGSYELTVRSIPQQGTGSSVTMNFLVSSFAIEQLRRTTDEFRVGAGVYYPSQSPGVTIRLSEANADEI